MALAALLSLPAACGPSEAPLPEVPDEEAAAQGRALYERYGCGTCHGRDGRGDGPVAVYLDPRPRDFRDLAAFRQGSGVSDIERTIRDGRMVKGKGMPGYPHLPAGERRLLARYVVSLRGE
jgi:high-affinity iron transporter